MTDTDTIINTEEGRVLPRLEKKARQTLAKLGLKKVDGITRVVLRRPQGVSKLHMSPSDCLVNRELTGRAFDNIC